MPSNRERDAAPPPDDEPKKPPTDPDETDDDPDADEPIHPVMAAAESEAAEMEDLDALETAYQGRTARITVLVEAAKVSLAALGFPVLGATDSAVAASHVQQLDAKLRRQAKQTALSVLTAIQWIAEDNLPPGGVR